MGLLTRGGRGSLTAVAERRLEAVSVVAVALAATIGLTIWWFSTADAPSSQPMASVAGAVLEREPAPPTVAADLRRSVRLVHAEGCGIERQATATVVQAERGPVAMTNQHVVAGSTEVRVDEPGGDPATVVAVAGRVDGRDVAELDGARMADAGVVPLEVGARPLVGARVVVAGYPNGRFEATSGVVRTAEVREGFGGAADVLLVDVEAVPGISGGVVVDATGRAVALVTARDPVTHDVVAYPLDQIGVATDDTTVPCP